MVFGLFCPFITNIAPVFICKYGYSYGMPTFEHHFTGLLGNKYYYLCCIVPEVFCVSGDIQMWQIYCRNFCG